MKKEPIKKDVLKGQVVRRIAVTIVGAAMAVSICACGTEQSDSEQGEAMLSGKYITCGEAPGINSFDFQDNGKVLMETNYTYSLEEEEEGYLLKATLKDDSGSLADYQIESGKKKGNYELNASLEGKVVKDSTISLTYADGTDGIMNGQLFAGTYTDKNESEYMFEANGDLNILNKVPYKVKGNQLSLGDGIGATYYDLAELENGHLQILSQDDASVIYFELEKEQ